MYAYIKKLQSKEEIIRKQILVASLIVSMAVVGSVWVYSLSDRFGDKEVAVADTTTTKPFALFSSSISDAYQNISASVANFSRKSSAPKTEPKQIDLIPVEPQAQ